MKLQYFLPIYLPLIPLITARFTAHNQLKPPIPQSRVQILEDTDTYVAYKFPNGDISKRFRNSGKWKNAESVPIKWYLHNETIPEQKWVMYQNEKLRKKFSGIYFPKLEVDEEHGIKKYRIYKLPYISKQLGTPSSPMPRRKAKFSDASASRMHYKRAYSWS